VKIVAFVIAMILFLGGLTLMGYAFQLKSGEAFMFFGGIIAVALALAVPFQFLGKQSH
jgi:hypothetical protein